MTRVTAKAVWMKITALAFQIIAVDNVLFTATTYPAFQWQNAPISVLKGTKSPAHRRCRIKESKKDFTFVPWDKMAKGHMEDVQMSSSYPEVPLQNLHHCLSAIYIFDELMEIIQRKVQSLINKFMIERKSREQVFI